MLGHALQTNHVECNNQKFADALSANLGFASNIFEVGERMFLPIDAAKDNEVISWYNVNLPIIERFICNQDDSSISITLLRLGDLVSSVPVIRIQTTKSRSKDVYSDIKYCLHRYSYLCQFSLQVNLKGLLKVRHRCSAMSAEKLCFLCNATYRVIYRHKRHV